MTSPTRLSAKLLLLILTLIGLEILLFVGNSRYMTIIEDRFQTSFADLPMLNCNGLDQPPNINRIVAKSVNFDWKTVIETGPITSLAGTSGTGIPGKIRSWLLSTGTSIDDEAQDYFGSEKAVNAMEEHVCEGWDAEKADFGNGAAAPQL